MPPKPLPEHLQHHNLVSWASDIEEGTLEQASALSRLPFICGHVALMADAHVGKGSTIGSVFATQGAIIPSAVGVDIGCGMAAIRFNIHAKDLPDDLTPLLGKIEQSVPGGVGKTKSSWGSNIHLKDTIGLSEGVEKWNFQN